MTSTSHPSIAHAGRAVHRRVLGAHARTSSHPKHEGLLHRLLHPFLHPQLRRHIHLGSLNVTVGAWQLLLWVFIIPLVWALYRFVYHRRAPHRRVAYALLGAVVPLQIAAFVIFALSRNADLLFAMLWLSLVTLLSGAVLLPQLRVQRVPAAHAQR